MLCAELFRPYYVSLLNAAAYYGAAHQQTQAFSVITTLPTLRNAVKKEVCKCGLDKQFFDFVPVSTVQRLGYLLECALEQPKLAEELYAKAQMHKCKFQKIPLKCSKKKGCFEFNPHWKVIINEQLEIDDL
jgi:hypothetical protein